MTETQNISNNQPLSYAQKWYQKNREKHLQSMKQKIYCDCGSLITKHLFKRHLESKKHQRWEELKKNNKQILCTGCGQYYLDHYKHIKTKKHQDYLMSLQ